MCTPGVSITKASDGMPEKIMNRSSDSSYMRTLRNKYADIEEVTGN